LINSTLDLDLVLNDVIDTVILLTGAERGYIVLRDPATGELEFRVARNAQRRTIGKNDVIVSHTVIDTVIASRQLVVTTDAGGDDRFNTSESVIDLLLRSILCVPLLVKGELTGLVYADNRMQTALFGKREQELVQAFANQAAIAIENARLFETVRASLAEITGARNLMDNVFSSIPSGVITVDGAGRIETFNAAAAQILNISGDGVIGAPLFEVVPPLFDGFERALVRVNNERTSQAYEVDTTLPTRGNVSLTIQLSPLKGADNAGGVTIVLNDVTELHERDRQIAALKPYLAPEMIENIRDFSDEAMRAQVREITVLSCDIRDFTRFSEGIEPEELMRVINQYLTVSAEAVMLREGIVDKFIGDAVIGLYNTQLNAQEDHALRAVQSGLTMVQDIEDLHGRLPEKYHIRYGIGIHTGTAILGNVGSARRKEFTAVGDTVQYAKFLQENALGGQVLVSAETFALVKPFYTGELVKPHRALNYYNGEAIYRITGRLRA
jgi:adenylate cyclase